MEVLEALEPVAVPVDLAVDSEAVPVAVVEEDLPVLLAVEEAVPSGGGEKLVTKRDIAGEDDALT